MTMKRSFHFDLDEDRMRTALRVTGNATFVAFALGRRRAWPLYLGAHAVHGALLVRTALAHRGRPTAFTATSRYGGALGYTTIAVLSSPLRRHPMVQTVGEQILFGLYAFTIGHGYLAKGRDARAYGPLAALWLVAAARSKRL
jgi:hypothetical protein